MKKPRTRKSSALPTTPVDPPRSDEAAHPVVASVDEGPADEPRGRPGRRTADERTAAVLELLSGKATAEQIGRRLGVHVETVVRWRDAAVASMAESLKQPDGKSKRERALERELDRLQHAFTRLAIKHEILDRELSRRPTPPGRSSR